MAAIELKLKPFRVPNYAIVELPPGKREEGFTEAPKFHLFDMEAETLSSMCDRFRTDVFDKAGKRDPVDPKVNPDAFIEGVQARRDLDRIHDNPYNEDEVPLKYASWFVGWAYEDLGLKRDNS